MMKNIINLIFAKNAKSSFVNTSQSAENIEPTRAQAANSSHQTHNSTNSNQEFSSLTFESAYEVEEISLDDFKYTGPERRKFPRKPGETRSCYSKNNNVAQKAA